MIWVVDLDDQCTQWDAMPYLQAIKDLDIDGVVSIELEYSPDPSRIVEWVEEAYRETAKRMDVVGLRG